MSDTRQCTPCPLGMSSDAGTKVRCTYCASGFVLRRYKDVADSADDCEECTLKQGEICAENTTLRTLHLAPGWWRLSEWTTDVRRCDAGACLGGALPGDASCATNQTGPMCRVCRGRHYYLAGKCNRCPDLATRVASHGVPLVVAVAAVGALLLLLLRYPERLPRRLVPLSGALRGAWHQMSALGLQPK